MEKTTSSGWQPPVVNEINVGIEKLNLFIFGKSKWGKTSLFRDVILEKFGDPMRGVLISVGNERGAKYIASVNHTHIDNWSQCKDLINYLVTEKGKSHNIEIACFDTIDELIPICESQTIKLSNQETPDKRCRTINGAFGGFQKGQKEMMARVLKPIVNKLNDAGISVWFIGHSKMRSVKNDLGDDYEKLTSNLLPLYDEELRAMCDGSFGAVVECNVKEVSKKRGDKIVRRRVVEKKKYWLFFRESSLVEAGSRSQDYSDLPEKMEFIRKGNNAKKFIDIIEGAQEHSKLQYRTYDGDSQESIDLDDEEDNGIEEIEEEEFDLESEDISEEEIVEEENEYPEELAKAVKELFKACTDKDVKAEAKGIITSYGKLGDVDEEGLKELYDILTD